MLLPLMASGVIYLFTSVNELQKEVELTALARLQMKVEIEEEVLANRERIHQLENRITVLETKNEKK